MEIALEPPPAAISRQQIVKNNLEPRKSLISLTNSALKITGSYVCATKYSCAKNYVVSERAPPVMRHIPCKMKTEELDSSVIVFFTQLSTIPSAIDEDPDQVPFSQSSPVDAARPDPPVPKN